MDGSVDTEGIHVRRFSGSKVGENDTGVGEEYGWSRGGVIEEREGRGGRDPRSPTWVMDDLKPRTVLQTVDHT